MERRARGLARENIQWYWLRDNVRIHSGAANLTSSETLVDRPLLAFQAA
jgi:hypothetical protein